MLSKPPHIITAQILVLEDEFHVVRAAFLPVNLEYLSEGDTVDSVTVRTLITVTSLLFLSPKASAMGFGTEIYGTCHCEKTTS